MKKPASAATIPTGCRKSTRVSVNYAIAERPADMTITTYLPRQLSAPPDFPAATSGSRRPCRTNYDGYFGYDSERAGGFEPLRYCRRATRSVVGVITSKSASSKDDIKRRLEEASKFAPPVSSRCRRNADRLD
jgi:5-methyltetrahydropteroyltriglutamate--homocysteine methyltransferase